MPQPRITVLQGVDSNVLSGFRYLIPQLGKQAPVLDADHLKRVIANPSNVILAADSDGRLIGLLTLVLVDLPTGITARLEDVVVDSEARGQGIGLALVRRAVDIAADRGASQVDLTSRPSRTAAHRLYDKAGFHRRETHVFRHPLT